MTKTKDNLIDIVEIILLLTLIAVRLFIKTTETPWISLLNYTALILSIVSLYLDLISDNTSCQYANFITGILIVILIPLIIIAALILTQIITLSVKANDVIMLLTLLVSLPARFYKNTILQV